MKTRATGVARWMNFAAAMLWAAALHAQPQPQPQDNAGSDADPPVRVGRLSFASGEVSFSPAGNDEWVQAEVNRPLATGDRVWADSNSRAEISVDNSTWWLGAQTSVTVSNLDDRIAQMQIQEGTIDVRVRRLPAGNIVEIDTPNLAFSVTRPGRYRVDVDPQGGSTMVVAREGAGEVYGENASYAIATGQAYRFYGTDVSDSELVALPAADAFEGWALGRDRRYTSAVSARYVSPDVVGYEDLDTYGTWNAEATYGSVWFPRSVNSGWAPYREGHWAWIDPWGWTWVDDEPWGFAPFHYGRWSHFSRGWGWVPGPRSVRAVYAPALVAFIGGAGFSLSVASGPAIGWFPLAPREVYVPPYHVSRNYFQQVNVSNTVVNVTNITNIYNNPTRATQINYANRGAPNAVTAVPPAAFAQSQNVGRVAIAMPAAAIQRAEVHPVARVAPARQAFVGAAPVARVKPPAAAMQRAMVAKTPPPPPPVPDAQRLQALEKNPGQPLSRAEVQTLRRAAPPAEIAAPAVKVVTQPKPQANAAPPARAAGAAGAARRNAPPAGVTPPGKAGERTGTEAAPAAKGPPTAPPSARGPVAPGGERSAPAAPTPPGAPAPGERRGPPANAGGARAPAAPTAPPAERAAPAPPPVARPPEARAPQRPPEARAPQPPPEVRAAPQRPPETRPAQPAPEARAPQRPPEAPAPRPPPEVRAAPQRPPETRPAQPAPEARTPQRPPEARPQPQPPPAARPPQPPPEARAAPQRPPQPPPEARAAPQRPPEARPQPQPPPAARPQPQPPPAARPEPPRPPQAQPRPESRPRPAEQKGEQKGKGNEKDQNP